MFIAEMTRIKSDRVETVIIKILLAVLVVH